MENKIKKLNKNIELKPKIVQKDNITVRLKNYNSDLLAKMVKQKAEHDKSMQEAKVELEKFNKQVVDLKAQTSVADRQNNQKLKEELKKAATTNQVLNNDNLQLL